MVANEHLLYWNIHTHTERCLLRSIGKKIFCLAARSEKSGFPPTPFLPSFIHLYTLTVRLKPLHYDRSQGMLSFMVSLFLFGFLL